MSEPVCPDCGVKGIKFITSPARLYVEPEAWGELPPMAFVPRWTGEWYCPKCKKILSPLTEGEEKIISKVEKFWEGTEG